MQKILVMLEGILLPSQTGAYEAEAFFKGFD
jgi:hypothetical protein